MSRARLVQATLLWGASCLAAGPAAAAEPLVIGIFPYLAAGELHRRFAPLADYLTERLDKPVTIDISPTYAAAVEQVGTGAVDVGFIGPAPYVQLVERYGPRRLLARFEVDGSATFRGYVVTREESPLQRLEDLAGRSFVFGDPESAMAHLVPRAMLARAGIPLDRLSRYAYVDSHDNVVLGVLAGAFDAGAVKGEVYRRYKSRGLRVLAVSPPISEQLFVAANHLPDETVTALRDALLALDSTTILSGLKEGATRLVPATDADYDTMRDLLKPVPESPDARH